VKIETPCTLYVCCSSLRLGILSFSELLWGPTTHVLHLLQSGHRGDIGLQKYSGKTILATAMAVPTQATTSWYTTSK